VKIFNHVIRDLLTSKVKKKHFVIKINITKNKNLSLIDNESEIEFINETFAQFNNLKLINLRKKNKIKLMLSDEKIAQILNKTTKVKIKTKSHRERLFCYVTKLNTYVFILKNEWLQTHNLIIDWRKREMKFSQKCVKTNCMKEKKKKYENKKQRINQHKNNQWSLILQTDKENRSWHIFISFETRLRRKINKFMHDCDE
jgi:hypothetical protein